MKKIIGILILFMSFSVSYAQDNSEFFKEFFDSSIPEVEEEKITYTNSSDFLDSFGDSCRIANDGCNDFEVKYFKLTKTTKNYCEEIYSSLGSEKWQCVVEIGELTTEEKTRYNYYKLNLKTNYKNKINEFLSDYKYKLYELDNREKKQELNDGAILEIENAIEKLEESYPNKDFPENINDVYMILSFLRFELIQINY